MRPAESRDVSVMPAIRWCGSVQRRSLACRSNLGVDRQMRVQAGSTELPTEFRITPRITRLIIDRDTCMRFLSYAYRISSNFVFLALVYYSLNFLEKYQQRAIVAILVLIYAAMRAASALRSFYFFQRIERLELEARRLAALTGDGPAASAARRQIVNESRRCVTAAK